MKIHQQTKYSYIDTPEELGFLVEDMKKAHIIAVDTEADSLHHFYEKVCLIQLTFDNQNFIIDPLTEMDLSDFLEVLASKSLLFHGADYDLRMLRSSFSFRPKSTVYDTLIAAQLLGFKKIGLASLVEKFFNFSMSKKGQKSDWAKRPLPENLLKYAADDTKYLAQIFEQLAEQLKELNRYEWFLQSCSSLVDATAADRLSDPDDLWRLKGTGKLNPKQLIFVKEIWKWRQWQAKKADVPPFKILVNSKIIELALWAGDVREIDFDKLPKLPRNCVNSRLEKLKSAIIKASNTTPEQWPQLKKRKRTDSFDYRNCQFYEHLKSEAAKLADSLKIDIGVLAPRAALVTIAKSQLKTAEQIVDSGAMLPWQATLLESIIEKIS